MAGKTTKSASVPAESGARAIWSGFIAFGLVLIPVTLHSAERRSQELRFRLLDKHDLSPIRYERVNAVTGEPVPWKEIVKGYEVEPDEVVVVEPADLQKANVRATKTIAIEDFVPADRISPQFFVTPYYLVPNPRAAKAYALLREALVRKEAVAIATFVLRSRQHLAALVPVGDHIVLEVLRYAHELRPLAELPALGERSEIRDRELAMAEQLIDGMMNEWDPSRYRDNYYADVMAMIEEKARKGTVSRHHAEKRGEVASNVVDLLDLLKKSVATKKPSATGKGESKGTRRKVRPAKRRVA